VRGKRSADRTAAAFAGLDYFLSRRQEIYERRVRL